MADNKKLHREQLIHKYETDGFGSLTEQERLELLLSYSCRGETKQLAEDLLRDYGSVNALSRADSGLLMKDPRINEQTAVLLRLIPSVSRALYRSDTSTYHSTVGDIVRFFQPVKDILDNGLPEG